jgi:hypothetical protein
MADPNCLCTLDSSGRAVFGSRVAAKIRKEKNRKREKAENEKEPDFKTKKKRKLNFLFVLHVVFRQTACVY